MVPVFYKYIYRTGRAKGTCKDSASAEHSCLACQKLERNCKNCRLCTALQSQSPVRPSSDMICPILLEDGCHSQGCSGTSLLQTTWLLGLREVCAVSMGM